MDQLWFALLFTRVRQCYQSHTHDLVSHNRINGFCPLASGMLTFNHHKFNENQSNLTTLTILISSFFLTESVPLFDYIENITIQFYADMTIQAFTSACFYTILVTSAGFYVSMCLYVGSMANDLRETIIEMDIDLTNQYNVDKFQRNYYEEVVFHSEVLRWGRFIALFSRFIALLRN